MASPHSTEPTDRLRREFDDEVWLTPKEIADKFQYKTVEPVLKAIHRGELRAHHSPCGRNLRVRLAEYFCWRDETLAYTPLADASQPAAAPSMSRAPRRSLPTLNYTDRERRP